jgi:hypothetical protein
MQNLAQIVYINDQKQFGVVATELIKEGQTIITENPIVSCQYAHNKDYFPACSHCLKSLESPEQMLKRLSGVQDDVQLFNSACLLDRSKITKCDVCLSAYCSPECLNIAHSTYQKYICAPQTEDNPLVQLEQLWKGIHFPPESGTVMLLVRMIAFIIYEIEHNPGKQRKDILGTFGSFTSQQYYSEFLGLSHRFMNEKYETTMVAIQELLCQAFGSVLPELFDVHTFKSMFSIMALNAQGIGTSSLEEYEIYATRNMSSNPEAYQESLDKIEMLQEFIEEQSGEFTHVEGSGLYQFQSKINHSCVPNTEVRFPYNNSSLQVVATRDIQPGEEITISYIEFEEDGSDVEETCAGKCSQAEDNAKNERKELLKEFYLFECQCEMCCK